MYKWIQSALDLFSASAQAENKSLDNPSITPTKPHKIKRTTRRLVQLSPPNLANFPNTPSVVTSHNVAPTNPLGHKTNLWKLPVFEDFSLPKNNLVTEADTPFEDTKPFVSHLPSITNAPIVNLLTHPLANHWITLVGAKTGPIELAYLLERGHRKSIGFTIDERGLRVKAPRQVGLFEIEQALHSKSTWILRKLTEMQQKAHSLVQKQISWEIGASLDYLGQSIQMQLDPSHQSKQVKGQLIDSTLYLHLPLHASHQQIKDCAQSWLMAQALVFFTERLNHFAPLLGVHWKQLKLSNAGTRWGSAKSDGSIRLHWRLIHFKPSVIDYVVVHELAHLRVMNHSPEFWDTVEQILPNYHEQKQHLKKEVLTPWN